MSPHGLRIERTLDAPMDKVRKALTDPALVAHWFAPGPMTAEVHVLDARVGGQYEITMIGPTEAGEERYTCAGVFEEVGDTRIQMRFSWVEEGLAKDTTLAFELEPVDDGTRLILTHDGLPTKESAAEHRDGWVGCVEKLAGRI